MLTLITGGSASGKSGFAEAMAGKGGDMLYIATMKPYDDECIRRIEKHRDMRRDAGFQTLELFSYGNFPKLLSGKDTILLECVSNMLANEMFATENVTNSELGEENIILNIVQLIQYLSSKTRHLIVVSNDINRQEGNYFGQTLLYVNLLCKINRRIAELADNVTEVVYGIPLHLKGGTI